MHSQTKLTRCIFVWHNLQGYSSVFQFLIMDLNIGKDFSYLQSLGKIFKILAPEEVIFTVPYLTEVTLLLFRASKVRKLYVRFLNLKTSSTITGFKPFFFLKILVASICRLTI